MRNLCLALILANLAFAVWQYGRPGPDPTAGAVGDVPTIELASEVAPSVEGPERGAATRPDVAPEPARSGDGDVEAPGAEPGTEAAPPDSAAAPDDGDTDAAEPGATAADAPAPAPVPDDAVPAPESAAAADLRCRSIGPFEELSQAAAAASALRADGYEPSQRIAEGEIWVGYWVYLPGVEDGAAGPILDQLAGAGIPEAYLISDALDGSNLISLGVFGESWRAERRRDEVRELGYEAVAENRTRQGNVYWVDVVLAPGVAALDLEGLQPADRIVRLEQRPCP